MSKKNQDTKKKQDKEFGTLTAVPDGFTMRLGPNGEECVVPQYLIPALDHAFIAFHKKADLEVLKAKPQVSFGTIGTMSFAAPLALPFLPFHAVSQHNCLYSLFPLLIFSMTDESSQKQPLFHAWREVDVSPRSGEEHFQWLDWVDLIFF